MNGHVIFCSPVIPNKDSVSGQTCTLLGAAPLLPAGEGTRFSGDGVAFGSAGEEDAFESGGGVTTSGAFDTGFRIALRELVEVGLAGGGGAPAKLFGASASLTVDGFAASAVGSLEGEVFGWEAGFVATGSFVVGAVVVKPGSCDLGGADLGSSGEGFT